MRGPIAFGIAGIGAEIVGMAIPQFWPDAPQWIWGSFVAFGAGLILFAIIWGVWPYLFDREKVNPRGRWLSMWSIGTAFRDRVPFRRLIPLKRAARIAYGKLQGTITGTAANHPYLSDNNPIKFFAAHMVFTNKLPLYGTKPHTQKVEVIPDDIIGQNWDQISDDLDHFGAAEGRSGLPIYEQLQMKLADVRNYVKTQKRRA